MEKIVLSCLESRIEENQSVYSRFLIGPFLSGHTVTIATDLRRALLSEVKNIAITALHIQGITNEFSTVIGVRESVLELSLNFQQIILSNRNQKTSRNVQVGYLHVQGPAVVYANDFNLPDGIECVNPTQYIATLSTEGSLVVKFLIGEKKSCLKSNTSALTSKKIKKAKRYCNSRQALSFQRVVQLSKTDQSRDMPEDTVDANSNSDDNLDHALALAGEPISNEFNSEVCLRAIIPLDPIFNPVYQVNFVVERDDLSNHVRERVIMEVWTNGSIHPRQAIHEAALSTMSIFSKLRKTFQLDSQSFDLAFKKNNKSFAHVQNLPLPPSGGQGQRDGSAWNRLPLLNLLNLKSGERLEKLKRGSRFTAKKDYKHCPKSLLSRVFLSELPAILFSETRKDKEKEKERSSSAHSNGVLKSERLLAFLLRKKSCRLRSFCKGFTYPRRRPVKLRCSVYNFCFSKSCSSKIKEIKGLTKPSLVNFKAGLSFLAKLEKISADSSKVPPLQSRLLHLSKLKERRAKCNGKYVRITGQPFTRRRSDLLSFALQNQVSIYAKPSRIVPKFDLSNYARPKLNSFYSLGFVRSRYPVAMFVQKFAKSQTQGQTFVLEQSFGLKARFFKGRGPNFGQGQGRDFGQGQGRDFGQRAVLSRAKSRKIRATFKRTVLPSFSSRVLLIPKASVSSLTRAKLEKKNEREAKDFGPQTPFQTSYKRDPPSEKVLSCRPLTRTVQTLPLTKRSLVNFKAVNRATREYGHRELEFAKLKVFLEHGRRLKVSKEVIETRQIYKSAITKAAVNSKSKQLARLLSVNGQSREALTKPKGQGVSLSFAWKKLVLERSSLSSRVSLNRLNVVQVTRFACSSSNFLKSLKRGVSRERNPERLLIFWGRLQFGKIREARVCMQILRKKVLFFAPRIFISPNSRGGYPVVSLFEKEKEKEKIKIRASEPYSTGLSMARSKFVSPHSDYGSANANNVPLVMEQTKPLFFLMKYRTFSFTKNALRVFGYKQEDSSFLLPIAKQLIRSKMARVSHSCLPLISKRSEPSFAKQTQARTTVDDSGQFEIKSDAHFLRGELQLESGLAKAPTLKINMKKQFGFFHFACNGGEPFFERLRGRTSLEKRWVERFGVGVNTTLQKVFFNASTVRLVKVPPLCLPSGFVTLLSSYKEDSVSNSMALLNRIVKFRLSKNKPPGLYVNRASRTRGYLCSLKKLPRLRLKRGRRFTEKKDNKRFITRFEAFSSTYPKGGSFCTPGSNSNSISTLVDIKNKNKKVLLKENKKVRVPQLSEPAQDRGSSRLNSKQLYKVPSRGIIDRVTQQLFHKILQEHDNLSVVRRRRLKKSEPRRGSCSSRAPADLFNLSSAGRKTSESSESLLSCIAQERLSNSHPRELDKMSFLSLDLANLSLSLKTYTFLKKKGKKNIANILEDDPDTLFSFLNGDEKMFHEINDCFLFLGLGLQERPL
jgi:DNA-directed RNA polymerase alpha subunit